MFHNLGINEGNSLIIFYCPMISKRPQDSVKELVFLCLNDGPLPSVWPFPCLDPNYNFHEKPKVHNSNCQISNNSQMKIKSTYYHRGKSSDFNSHKTHIGFLGKCNIIFRYNSHLVFWIHSQLTKMICLCCIFLVKELLLFTFNNKNKILKCNW